jgi:N-acetylmuramoyl-L-alanine amidase
MRFLTLLMLMLSTGLAVAQPVVRDVPVRGEPRQVPVRQIVIHATGGPDCDPSRSFRSGTLEGIVGHFQRNQQRISIHYIIGRNGEVVRLVPETRVAFHVRGHNADSIGIELVNDGDGRDPFSEPQIEALVVLLRDRLARYRLDITALKSHAELDDSELVCDGRRLKRKVDPGAAFPWERIRAALDGPTGARTQTGVFDR